MQLLDDGAIVYSATDLNNFLECSHLVALERAVALRELTRPERSETLELIARKGDEHERAYLETLRSRHPDLVEIAKAGRGRAGIERASAETEAAMAAGASVIYQATFFDGTFLGAADFLFRNENPSARWAWSYEVADTKLALREKPYFIVQLSHYSEHVARVQGIAPVRMHLILGQGERRPFLVDDYAAYYRHLKATFLASGASGDAYPLEVPHCAICNWAPACERRRADDDHLSLVANMRRDQIAKCEAAGIATLEALAAPDAVRPQSLAEASFERLSRQARLQYARRTTGEHRFELLAHAPAIGFGLLPAPALGDVFFDMEGDPFFEIGTGIEYLFGCYAPDDDVPFIPFWGTDRAGEKRAFEDCIDFLTERRKRFPNMHVYHYASYEKTKLKQLWERHDTREEEVDELLRGEVLVDLYDVVRQTLAISQPSYSIKKLEPFYDFERTADVRKGDDSVVNFERWLENRDRRILDDIGHYNEEDCISTWRLRDWLLERRADYIDAFGVELEFRPVIRPDAPCHDPAADGCKKCEKRERERREAEKISAVGRALAERSFDPDAPRLAHLVSYHRREEKPGWWKFFDRCKNVDELVEFDREAVGGLQLAADVAPERVTSRSWHYTYRFPDQVYHIEGDVVDPSTKKGAGTIVSIDDDGNLLVLKRTVSPEDASRLTAIIPGGPIVAEEQKRALLRVGEAYLAGTLATSHRAAADILARAVPHLSDRLPGARIQPSEVTTDNVYAVVRALDRSYLVLQGPPGTGKTYAGARIIARLLLAGKRVGIMATGHKVIHNMLHALEVFAANESIPLDRIRGVHKHSTSNPDSPFVSKLPAPYVRSEPNAAAIESGDENLISGNGWLFARENMVDRLDYLFIDEAGQMPLAEVVAVAPCASNVVMLGDPQQLAHVRQGSHLEGAEASVLKHLIGDAATIDPSRGILLDVSYRMEPSICEFVSRSSYDGRLRADPPTRNNLVRIGDAIGRGLRFLPIEHVGNAAESQEEADAIRHQIDDLMRGSFVRKNEGEAPLRQSDILIVTPYNAQRRRIKRTLQVAGYPDIAVGTVDKFQGQEAPVVFYSMAASTAEDAPRSIPFLFDPNRFNVAISRAQCIAFLVCSPALLDARCTSVEQIAMVNTVCRYVEDATAALAGIGVPGFKDITFSYTSSSVMPI